MSYQAFLNFFLFLPIFPNIARMVLLPYTVISLFVLAAGFFPALHIAKLLMRVEGIRDKVLPANLAAIHFLRNPHD